jgi:hypothetical protein
MVGQMEVGAFFEHPGQNSRQFLLAKGGSYLRQAKASPKFIILPACATAEFERR